MLLKQIEKSIDLLDTTNLSIKRKQVLQPLIDYIQSKVNSKQIINLNFICTHNSRRSHLAQVWAQTLSYFYNIKNVFCYSGGTETTQVFPIIIETLKNTGFKIDSISERNNPVYNIKYSENSLPISVFSKKYNDDFNPNSNFAAILTCSQADKGCPFITGAEKRIPIIYDDPKQFDNTSYQKEKYKERSIQIATELSYVFSQIK